MPRTLSATLLVVALSALSASEDSPTIIVSAERRETELARAPVSIALVTDDLIAERGGAINLTDWLVDLPGVGVWNTGGGIDGGTTSVRLRGLDGKYTLFLVDGIPQEDQSAINGGTRLPLSQTAGLTSIELVKGSQSGLYGSGAIGGVVDLRTARPTPTHEVKVSATAGSFASLGGEVVATGPLGHDAGYAVSMQGLSSGGFSAATSDPAGDPAGFEADAVQRWAGRGRFELQVSETAMLYATGAMARNVQEYDGTGPDDGASENSYEQWQVATGGEIAAGRVFTGSFDVSYQQSTYTSAYSTFDPGTYEAATLYGTARGSWSVQEHLNLGVGLDARRDTAMTKYGPTADPVYDTGLNQYGLYTTASWSDGRFDVTATGRVDRHQTFGTQPTGRLAAAWFVVPERLKLRGAASTGFRAPTLYQLYNVEPFFSNGNPDLDPETSASYESGVDWTPGGGTTLSVTAFRSEVEDLIVYVDPDGFFGPLLGTYVNDRGSSTTTGLEASGVLKHALAAGVDGKLEAAYTMLDAVDADGDAAPFAPEHAGSVRATLHEALGGRVGSWQTLAVRRSTAYFASPGEQDRVDGATVLDAAVGVSLDSRWDLSLRIDNLLDERYVVNSSFGTVFSTAPRSYWLTLAGRF